MRLGAFACVGTLSENIGFAQMKNDPRIMVLTSFENKYRLFVQPLVGGIFLFSLSCYTTPNVNRVILVSLPVLALVHPETDLS